MLLEQSVLIELVERAAKQLDAPDWDDVAVDHTLEHQLSHAAYVARASVFGFAGAAFAAARHPRLRWALRASRKRADGFDDFFLGEKELIYTSIERLLMLAGPDAVARAEPLLQSPIAGVRAAVARGLERYRDQPAAQALLETLCRDGELTVRATARKVLGPAAPVPWAGVFPADPLAAYAPARATELAQPLAAALEALERGPVQRAEPLATALETLPDELAAPILDRAFASQLFWHEGLAARWLRLPQAAASLRRAVEQRPRDGFMLVSWLGPVIFGLPAETHEALVRELALSFPVDVPREDGGTHHFQLEQLVVNAWPAAASLAPLLEAWLGCPPREAAQRQPQPARADSRLGKLLGALLSDKKGCFGEAFDAALEALEAGWPGAWAPLHHELRHALMHTRQARLRALAQRWLSGTVEQTCFALLVLLQTNYDEGVDPPRESLFAQVVDDARLRAAALTDYRLCTLLHPALRARLGAGTLTPQEAAAIASELGACTPHETSQLRAAAQAADDPQTAFALLRRLSKNEAEHEGEPLGDVERGVALRWLEAWREDPHDEELMVQLALAAQLWPRWGQNDVLAELNQKCARAHRRHLDAVFDLVGYDATKEGKG